MSADRVAGLDDTTLAAAIRGAGGDLRWPPTPDVAEAVRREIATVPPRPGVGPVWPAMPRRRRLILLIAAALVLLGGAAVAAKLVIDLGAVTITTTPGPPTTTPSGAVAATELGVPVTLAEAERATGIAPRVPAALGTPDDVWIDEGSVAFDGTGTTTWIAMAWDAGEDLPPIGGTDRGAVLLQFRGDADVAAKVLFEDAGSFLPVRLDGRQAYWITGVHGFRLPIDGELRELRVDGNVLLWQAGADTFRLETALPVPSAKAIARTTG